MTPERLALVKASLDELLSLPADKRVRWLERRCRDDAPLRAELESLLGIHREDPPDSTALGADGSRRREAALAFGELVAGRYRVGAWLGRGATGDVYLVHDRTSSRSLALKASHPGRAISVLGLDREARLASRIEHPAVCRVYDAFEYGGRACLLMEFVDGEDLATLLAQVVRLPPARVREIGRVLAEGLGAAHELGIVHRDLKPGNILIDRSGRVKVTDFGIAATAEEKPDGWVVGTPGYMAPEQLRGDGPITPRCDVYALAAVLFEAVTGRPPFTGSDPVELVDRKLAGPAPPPSRFCPEIDPELEAAIVAGLSLDPGDRPESGRAFAALLASRMEESGPDIARPEQRMVSVLSVGIRLGSGTRMRRAPEVIDRVSRIVAEHAGHVAAVSPSSVLAYFGFPTALEAHSDRALRAARSLVTAGVGSTRSAGATLHVGVDTGEVLIERVAAGSGGLAFGDPSEGAERLREAASAGEALVSPESLRWAREPFATSAEVRVDPGDEGGGRLAYRLDPKAVPSAGFAGGRREAEFVGRSEPLGRLEALWARVRSGRSAAVLVTGEAGIGKSRLIRTFRERLSGPSCRWLGLQSIPERRSSAFWPLRRLVEQDGLAADAATETHGTAATEAFTEGVTRAARIEALVRWLRPSSREEPSVLVCEDLHWCDPSTLDVVDALVADAGSSPLLVIAAARPGVVVPWHVDSVIQLQRLAPDEAALLLDALVEGRALDAATRAHVLERGQGIPLYLQALVEQAAQSGALDGRTPRVPESLRGLLEAQLDRLGRARTSLQLGACLGYRFARSHLAAIRRLEPEDLAEDLDRLVEAGVLHRTEERSDGSYEFHHALLADAAYGTLPEAQRQEAHAAIAWTLAEVEPALAEQHPELLAVHVERAGAYDAALEAWERAGNAATGRAENIEARRHFERALALVSQAVEPERRDEVELRLRMALTEVLATINFSAFELERNLERCWDLIGNDADVRAVSVLVQRGRVQILRGELSSMSDLIERSLHQLPAASRDLAVALHSQTASYYTDYGDLDQARHHHQKVLEIVPPDVAEIPSHPLGQLGFAAAVPTDAWRLWYEGRYRAADARVQQWIPRIGELPPFFAATSTGVAAPVVFLLGDLEAARSLARDLVDLSVELGFAWLEAWAGAVIGSSLVDQGKWEDGVLELRTNVARMRNLGLKMLKPFAESFLANALVELDRLDEADAALESAFDDVARGADRVWEPDLHRVRGRLRARAGEPGEAERSLRHAVSLARERGSRALELRAATELASWLSATGRPEDAHTPLAPICAAFEGELETPDLRAARRMLAD